MTAVSIRLPLDLSRLDSSLKLGFVNAFSQSNASASSALDPKLKSGLAFSGLVRLKLSPVIRAMEESRSVSENRKGDNANASRSDLNMARNDVAARSETNSIVMSHVGKSTNIIWQECSIGKLDRQKLLGQKGCVIWITGLSGSGKSTLACALSQALHSMGKLSYILDGDNVRHGLNRDLSFKADDRAENIRRIGEVAKLFADAGIICIASLISPYRRDRDACRALMPDGNFIEVFMNVPLEVCEARDAKGLYKLARAGKIKGFTGIDDPYEPPLNCEIEIQQENGVCASPSDMAGQVISYLEGNGFLYY